MSAHSPVGHYLQWFMGFIQANLTQHLVPLWVHGCDACLSLTELMLLLLSMCMHPSFTVFVLGWLNPGDFASTVGHYWHCWCLAIQVHVVCVLIIQTLHLWFRKKITCVGDLKKIEDPNGSGTCPGLKKYWKRSSCHRYWLGSDTTQKWAPLFPALRSASACWLVTDCGVAFLAGVFVMVSDGIKVFDVHSFIHFLCIFIFQGAIFWLSSGDTKSDLHWQPCLYFVYLYVLLLLLPHLSTQKFHYCDKVCVDAVTGKSHSPHFSWNLITSMALLTQW